MTTSLNLSAVPKVGRFHALEIYTYWTDAKECVERKDIPEALNKLRLMEQTFKAYEEATGGHNFDCSVLGQGETRDAVHQYVQDLRKQYICWSWRSAQEKAGKDDINEASFLLNSAEDLIKCYNFAEQDLERKFQYSWLDDRITKDVFIHKLQGFRIERARRAWDDAHDCYREADLEQAQEEVEALQLAIDDYNATARAEEFDYSWLGDDPQTKLPVTKDIFKIFELQVQRGCDEVNEAAAETRQAMAQAMPKLRN